MRVDKVDDNFYIFSDTAVIEFNDFNGTTTYPYVKYFPEQKSIAISKEPIVLAEHVHMNSDQHAIRITYLKGSIMVLETLPEPYFDYETGAMLSVAEINRREEDPPDPNSSRPDGKAQSVWQEWKIMRTMFTIWRAVD